MTLRYLSLLTFCLCTVAVAYLLVQGVESLERMSRDRVAEECFRAIKSKDCATITQGAMLPGTGGE